MLTNFGWEYVWHCHLLGHEENDMMRPMVFVVATALPPVPNLPTGTGGVASHIGKNTLTWTEAATTTANAPTGFIIERATGAASTTFTTIAKTTTGTVLTYVDSSIAPSTMYRYRVSAYNPFGTSAASTIRNGTSVAWTAPSVVLNAPVTGSTINLLNRTTATATITLTATPTAGGTATVTKVDFYNGSSLLDNCRSRSVYV